VGKENPVLILAVEPVPSVLQEDAAVLGLAVGVGVADGVAFEVLPGGAPLGSAPFGGAPLGSAPFGGAPLGGVNPAGGFIPEGMLPPEGGPLGWALSAGIDGSAVAVAIEVLLFSPIIVTGAVTFTLPRSVTTSAFKFAAFSPDGGIDNSACP
jgi:hypothetical protein